MEVVTTAQAAMLLQTTEANVRQMARRGILPRAGKRGSQRTYPLSAVRKIALERFPRVVDEHSE